jgi:hypothetical protein
VSRREDFDNGFWRDPDVYPLSPHAKLVYIWTWTNSHCNLAGLYEVHPAIIAGETRLTDKRVQQALEEIQVAGLVAYDGRLLWVKGRIGQIGSKNSNVGKAIGKDLARIGSHPFVDELRARYAPFEPDEKHWLHFAFNGNGKPHG